MLRVLRAGVPGFLIAPENLAGWTLPSDTAWIDLNHPSAAEEALVEAELGVGVPTREDMVEIEASSRLYQRGGATYLTAAILCRTDSEAPTTGPITFVLARGKLVTVRYVEPTSFKLFNAQADQDPAVCPSGAHTLLNLLEAVVDRAADVLERNSATVEAISGAVFAKSRSESFRQILNRLGLAQRLNAKIRESLASLARLISFAAMADEIEGDKDAKSHLKSLGRDVASITDHAAHLSNDVIFLLDAALGQINIEQNDIIKIFSVAAVAFLPPTLIASIYGMNFKHMPELEQLHGYPLALVAMVASALVPLWWFKRKGWL